MKRLFVMLPVVVLAALPACMLNELTKPSPAAEATSKEIDVFLKKAVQADTLAQRASMHLLKAVAAKEAVAIEAKMMAAKATKDPGERQAKVDAVHADLRTTLVEVDFVKESENVKAERNAAKNEAIKSAVWDLALVALKDVELVNSGERLASGTLSPEVIGKIPAVMEAIRRLVSQGKAVTEILTRATSLMFTVGLESLPTSASEEPRLAT